MDAKAVALAVEAWAVAAVPALSSYDFPPEELLKALPLVIAEVQRESVTATDTSLPGVGQHQQTLVRAWVVNLTILSTPDPAWTASYALYGYVDALGHALRLGVVLAPNVAMSQFYTANFNPPEVEYADGTIARQVTVTVTVGEQIGV